MTMTLQEESIKLHKDNKGKLGVTLRVPLKDRHDLSIAYTPGVAAPCLAIKENEELSFSYTCRGNMVAVVSDGTRVLGLGDIGPAAALPVMEGKSVLFKHFADVDAMPICLDTKEPAKIIETVRLLQPTFAGINLEDLSSPKCYDIEDALREVMEIPVFHDDQHGTAIAALSALLGALRFVQKKIENVKIVVNGAGAAGTAIARLLLSAGAQNLLIRTVDGTVYEGMPGLDRIQTALAAVTNKEKVQGDLATAAKAADVLIGVSAPGVFTREIIQNMAKDAIVLAMANPTPEISYQDAIAFGAAVVGTGRSDSPNQVNNVTVFPGIFRGALDTRARCINEEMKIAAAYAIAGLIKEEELKADYVVPDAFDPRVAPAVAASVAKAAMATGVARIKVEPEAVHAQTVARTRR